MFARPQGVNSSQEEPCIAPGTPTAVDQEASDSRKRFWIFD